MGQYLAIGLAHEIIISLDDLRKEKISENELQQEIEQSLLFDLNLYDEAETNKNLLFTLKNQVLDTELIPFLEAIYPIIYYKKNNENYLDQLKQLRSTPSTKWLDFARGKSNTAFYFDTYAESRYIKFSKPFLPEICINFNYVMLYLGYGKIITEGIYDFLDIFKYCIHETFKEHPIAKSIQIYVTG